MNKEESLYSQFNCQYVKLNNEYFVQQSHAITFIELLFENNVKILGIDGFDINQNTIKPNIKVISDWSDDSMGESIKKSKKFISENNNLVSHFNFTLDI